MYPIKKICSECERKFEAVTPNQDVCTGCLLKPARPCEIEEEPPDPEKKKYRKEEGKRKYKDKLCGVCKKMYTPTGSRQDRCGECIREGRTEQEVLKI